MHPAAERLMPHFAAREDAILDAVRRLVEEEASSRDKPRLDAFAAGLARRYEAAGARAEIVANPDGGDHVRAQLAGGEGARPALVLCHYDTVWPAGALAAHPFRVEAGKAYGPGIFDMRASLTLVEFVLRAAGELRLPLPRPVTVLATSDEEIGSATSRALIEDEARRAAYALVLEPPLPGGALKTARKAVGAFTVEVVGRAAHAGVAPETGINAIAEMALQIAAIRRLENPAAGTTVNPGVIAGGTATNVIPARCALEVDARAWTREEADRVAAGFAALAPTLPGAEVRVSGGWSRPPLERAATAAMFGRAREIGSSLGMELEEGGTGGGSDGNFTGALGVPTLDGLGVPGDGAHADHEHILVDGIAPRAALLAALLLGL